MNFGHVKVTDLWTINEWFRFDYSFCIYWAYRLTVMITINYFHCMSSPQNLIFLGVYKQFPTLRYATVAVGHVWKSSVYIILLTLFCVIASWKPDFQSFLNLSFSLGYSLRKLVVQESTAKCLSSRWLGKTLYWNPPYQACKIYSLQGKLLQQLWRQF